MNEVSCKVFGLLVKPLERKGVTLAEITAGTNVPAEKLRRSKDRIDWADYVAIMRNVRKHFTDDEYIELGRSYLQSPGLRFAFVIARLLLSPMDFYRWLNRPSQGVGNQMFECVIPTHRELSKNEIEVDLVLPPNYALCWDFYLITLGNMEEVPRLLGLPRAKVKLTAIPRGARFHITMPLRTPLVARIWRTLTFPWAARAAARELREAHETLLERYHEIEDARTKLDRQATQLRTAYTVADMIHRDLDLTRTLEIGVRAVVEEAGFASAELVLVDRDRRAHHGEAERESSLRYSLLTRGGHSLGELIATPQPGSDRDERQGLLDFIGPTLALAIENALYRTELERVVDERTTELRQARDELAGTVAQLREAQGARERFFGNISHEIRTPLSIIMLAVNDIERRAGSKLDERGLASLGAVTDSASKLVRLVDELLLLAAGQEGKLRTHPEPTDLAQLLGHVVSAWRPMAEQANLQLETRIPASLIANVDPVAIERVVSNLLSNAIKYTPSGSVLVEVIDHGDGLQLSVLDTGTGIDPELSGRLFGRFERSSEHRHTVGTGIGLALCKQLVEAHGGVLRAIARDGGGTEMRVVLPAATVIRDPAARVRASRPLEAQRAATPATAMRFAPVGTSRGTILLAEDDRDLADMVARLLVDEGFTVVVAHDGDSALALVREHQPQLLISDVAMPGLDGIELARRFHEVTADRLAPIIILSAKLDLGVRLAGLDAGAVDYLAKPVAPRELVARVHAQFRMRDLAVRLHRAEHLSGMSILTSSLAHELRNPANGVINALHPLTELLPRELTSRDTPVGQLLDVLGDCAEQIGFLSRQLLGFRSDRVELELRDVPLRELVVRAISLMQGTFTDIELRTELEDVPIRCAPPLLTQVFSNLIANAAQAAGRGGWVAISARHSDTSTSVEIADSGPGVPAELRDRVFEPFFTTKPPGVGTGLGLSLARDIVHRHGGTLQIHDSGSSSVFVVELPGNPVDATPTAM
ncbi:MAG: ATP-binding protein [Kofleriaceae bacterium]